jgi:hypothetical protein
VVEVIGVAPEGERYFGNYFHIKLVLHSEKDWEWETPKMENAENAENT